MKWAQQTTPSARTDFPKQLTGLTSGACAQLGGARAGVTWVSNGDVDWYARVRRRAFIRSVDGVEVFQKSKPAGGLTTDITAGRWCDDRP